MEVSGRATNAYKKLAIAREVAVRFKREIQMCWNDFAYLHK